MNAVSSLPRERLLLRCLRDPGTLGRLDGPQWEQLLRQAAPERLDGRIAVLAASTPPSSPRPQWLVDRLTGIDALSGESTRALLWELNRIRRAFSGYDLPVIALKGAAYAASRLPLAVGRPSADVDILVPHDRLEDATAALLEQGWEFLPLDAYDERYYREWMHELPPMYHQEREMALDVHHTILPRTGRVQPDANRLLVRAIPSAEADVLTLCPSHVALHAAAHLFQDGEVAGSLRDVVDIDALLRHFAATDGFWDDFAAEAEALGLERSAYYAVTASIRLFQTPVPDDVRRHVTGWGPGPVVDAMMARLIDATLTRGQDTSAAAEWALYLRSHWLRMPPLLLIRHLAVKSARALKIGGNRGADPR